MKEVRHVVGMMSGTSVDGVDAALVEISGTDSEPKVKLLAFENKPYPPQVREKIFSLFTPANATVDKVGYMNFLLGEIYAKIALSVIEKAGMKPEEIDVIGSHGQTIWHAPIPESPDGIPVAYTVQIGEGSVIAERTGILTVSRFPRCRHGGGRTGRAARSVLRISALPQRKRDDSASKYRWHRQYDRHARGREAARRVCL